MINITATDLANAKAIPAKPRERREHDLIDFKIRPISQEWRYSDREPSYQTAVCNAAYIWRDAAPIDRRGAMPAAFAERRCELRDGGLLLPASAPVWASVGYRIWEDADAATAATGDTTAVSAWHMIAEIPKHIAPERWSWLARGFLERELVDKGAAVAWATHGIEGADGDWIIPGHVHAIISARYWRSGPRQGQRHPAWAASTRQQTHLAYAWRHRCRTAHAAALQGWQEAFR